MSPVVSTVVDVDTVQDAPVLDDTARSEIAELQRAFHGPDQSAKPSTPINNAQLTVTRNHASDFQDRQVYLYLDGELWGKVKYNRPVTREIPPGRHTVRAFNTLFSHTIEIDAVPGEHVRLKCTNALGKGGWIMMVIWQIAALRVRLEREL